MTLTAKVVLLGTLLLTAVSCTQGSTPGGTVGATDDDSGAELQQLAGGCREGDFSACDQLWDLSSVGSAEERLAASCGDRLDVGSEAPYPRGNCADRFSEERLALLDELAGACQRDDFEACDVLWQNSDPGSEYQRIAASCNEHLDPGSVPYQFGACVERFVEVTPPPTTSSAPPTVTVNGELFLGAERGLLCRDLAPRGFSYAEAYEYWEWDLRPDRMDSDLNGIPCETVYPPDEVFAHLGESGVLDQPEEGSWVVILSSVATEDGLQIAIDAQDSLVANGVDARIFLSTEFSSLNPDYFVVYTGEFTDPDSAIARCAEVRSLVTDCYHRLVTNEET